MPSSKYWKVDDSFEIHKIYSEGGVQKCAPHYHNAYEAYYLIKGQVTYFIHDQCYSVKKGDFVLVDSYEIHNCIYTSNDHERILMTYKPIFVESNTLFKVPDIFTIFNKKFHGCRSISLPPQMQQKIESILFEMLKIYESNKNAQYTPVYLHSYLSLVHTYIADYLTSVNSLNEPNIHDNKIRSIIAYLNNNLDKELSLDEVSRHFNMNKFYLCRYFKEYTGLSIVDYINRRRVITAEKLIALNKYSITDISLMSGFNSLTHFGRVFKQITGISPRDYKKKHNI